MAATRVIFLDDDEDLRDVFTELLTVMGVSVEAVGSVSELEAVVSARGSGFDLAILDVNLGPAAPSGVDAYRWLKEHEFAGRVVFLTGHGRSQALEGARDVKVLGKPISATELRAILQ